MSRAGADSSESHDVRAAARGSARASRAGRPATGASRRSRKPRAGYGPGEGAFSGAFVGVLTPCVYAVGLGAIDALAWGRAGGELSFDLVWRFLLFVVELAAVPSIPAWTAAGAFVGLVLGLWPERARIGATSLGVGASAGAISGLLCGLSWQTQAPAALMASIGTGMGLAIAAALAVRAR